MAETETSASPSPAPEALPGRPTFDATQSLPAIALSEENLLALLGSAPPAAVTLPTPAASEPPTVAPAPVEPTPMTPAPDAETGPRATAAPPQRPETVDSTLALLAAIKENRAGLLRTETSRTESSHIKTLHKEPLRVETSRAESLRIEATKRSSVPVISAPRAAPLPDVLFTAATGPSPLDSALGKVPGGPRTLLIAGALIAVGGITTGLLVRSHRTHKPAAIVSTAPAPISAPTPNANFPLRLELSGPGFAGPGKGPLEVRWNPKSTLIAQARSGRLVVTEANQPPRTIPLSLSQLEMGHLSYQQQTERAQLRLEVVDASGSVAEESAMSGTPGATPAPATAANAPKTVGPIGAPVPAPTTSTAAPPAATAAPALSSAGTADAPAAPTANRPAPRAFTPPAVNRAGQPSSIEDAPPAVDASPAAPISLIYAPVPRAALPPPPAPASPTLPPATPRIRVDGNLQAAKLVKQVAPVYPPLAKTARVQGTVRFQAVIGKDGIIRNLDMSGGPALLQQAAINAVKQWTYRPTLLNGQAVEVSTTIEVVFTLGQ